LDQDLFSAFPNVSQQKADLKNIDLFNEAVLDFQPDAIIHCAATGVRPSNVDWFEVIDINVNSTVQIFKASCELPNCHFVHVSTGLVYDAKERPCREDDPIHTLHPYGSSKAAADCLLLAGADRMKKPLTVVRPFSFTGLHDGGDRIFPSLLRSALHKTPFLMSLGTQVRDFCAVQDVAEAISLLLSQKRIRPGPQIYNIGSGHSISLAKIVTGVVAQLELNVDIVFGALPFHSHEPMHFVADTRRIGDLGWRPSTNLAYAVYQLAREQFPDLPVTEPRRIL
jgi:nucleoside-diphosphate-sugar epimerase